MRRSNILLGVLAISTGILVGLGSPKEVRATNATIDIGSNTEVSASSNYFSSYTSNDNITLTNAAQGPITLVLDKNLSLKSLNVKFNNAGDYKDLTIKGTEKLTLNNSSGNGLLVNKLNIESGTVDATGGSDAIYAREGITISGGNVTAISQNGTGIESNSGDITITGGEIESTGKAGGIITYNGNISINGGSVNAKSSGQQSGIAAQGVGTGIITITDAKVTATATNAKNYGIYANGTITIKNSSVIAKGGSEADGIFTTDDISISGAATVVEASGGTGAIIADRHKITISDPLKVVKPEGGGVSADGSCITNIAGKDYTDIAKDVVIKAESASYTVTTKAENGTATAKPETAEEGAEIKLMATPADGYEFVNWTSEDGVSFADAKSANTTFKMLAKNVTVTAVFKKKGDPDPTPTPDPKHKKHTVVPRDDDGGHEDNTPAAATNPLSLILVRTTGLPYGTIAARAEQGIAAKAVFAASTPAGWKEGFSFNLITNGKNEMTLKNGTFTLQIPKDLQKAGRTFAILALDKNGKAVVLPDLDTDPTTITVAVNLEGYAFDLIYKD